MTRSCFEHCTYNTLLYLRVLYMSVCIDAAPVDGGPQAINNFKASVPGIFRVNLYNAFNLPKWMQTCKE